MDKQKKKDKQSKSKGKSKRKEKKNLGIAWSPELLAELGLGVVPSTSSGSELGLMPPGQSIGTTDQVLSSDSAAWMSSRPLDIDDSTEDAKNSGKGSTSNEYVMIDDTITTSQTYAPLSSANRTQAQSPLDLSQIPIDVTVDVLSDNIAPSSHNDHQNASGFVNKAFDEDKSKTRVAEKRQSPKNQEIQQIEEEITKMLDEEDRKDVGKEKKKPAMLSLVNLAMTPENEGEASNGVLKEGVENQGADGTNEASGWRSPVIKNFMNLNRIMIMLDPNREVDEEGQSELKEILTPDYLILAVRNDSPHLVERLLDRSTAISIFHALMFSINLGRDHITMMFLSHPKYELVRQMSKLAKLGALHMAHTEEAKEKLAKETAGTDEDDAIFSSDVTPIMLAAQRNQFDVVKSLLEKGEIIDEPHPYSCKCKECTSHPDELRQAKTKLNTYKALASDAYIVLANEDPIFVCFELGQKLRKLATEEKHFKASYLAMAEQCSVLASKLLDRVRDGAELDTLLDEKAGSGLSAYDNLARLKLAIHHREKKFVAHPACQKKLASLWFMRLNQSWVENLWRVLVFVLCLTLLYPFLAIIYWIHPWNKIGRFLRIPLVKFAAATSSYIIFLVLLIAYTATEKRSSGFKLYDDLPWSLSYLNMTNDSSYPFNRPIDEIEVRAHSIGFGTIMLSIWLLGLIWDNIKKMYQERFMYFTENSFNLLDFIMLFLYIISFSFRFAGIGLVNTSISYFEQEESWIDLANNVSEAVDKSYWLDADRSSWRASDPSMIAEAIFAVASLMSVCKLTHVFTISERIGPLLISLARMIQDMFAFMVIFVFIMAAFVIGFHNLFWYFYVLKESVDGTEPEAVNMFSSFEQVIETCFWSIFGLVEMDENMFHTFDAGQVTTITGHVMFAFYNWLMIIILINMLIAMMSRSYEFIAAMEDTEWKYARTKLFLEYIRDDSTLTVPFNLMPTWKGVYLLCKKMSDNWCRRCAGRPVKQMKHANPKIADAVDNSNMFYSPNLNGKAKGSMNLTTQRGQSLTQMTKSDSTRTKSGKNNKWNARQPSDQYKLVIQQVVTRFIQHHGKGKSGDGGDLDQLKQDMSTLRQELMTNLYNQENEREKMANKINRIQNQQKVSQTHQQLCHRELQDDSEQRSELVRNTIHELDTHIKDFQDATCGALRQFQHDMHKQIKELHTSMEILKDGLFRLCADVTVMRGRSALSRDVIIKQEAGGSHDDLLDGAQEVGARFEGTMSDIRRYDDYGPIAVTARKVIIEK